MPAASCLSSWYHLAILAQIAQLVRFFTLWFSQGELLIFKNDVDFFCRFILLSLFEAITNLTKENVLRQHFSVLKNFKLLPHQILESLTWYLQSSSKPHACLFPVTENWACPHPTYSVWLMWAFFSYIALNVSLNHLLVLCLLLLGTS